MLPPVRRKTVPIDRHTHAHPRRACLEGFGDRDLQAVAYSALHRSSGRSGFGCRWSMPSPKATLTSSTIYSEPGLSVVRDGEATAAVLCLTRPLLSVGTRKFVSSLLRVGAQSDVNVVSCSSKRSALYTTTVLGHEAVARCLIGAGADVNVVGPAESCCVLNEAIRGARAAGDRLADGRG